MPVDLAFRKVLLRKRLLEWADDGPVYVPFIGDGTNAAEIYADRDVFGADIEASCVSAAADRLGGDIRIADCNTWPFVDRKDVSFAVADFDHSEPYPSFRAFWEHANKANRVVVVFTDGNKRELMRTGNFRLPDGSKQALKGIEQKQAPYSFYLTKFVWPWFDEFVLPYRVLHRFRYLQGKMTYWGAVVEQ